jgi:hypothetical protein
MKRAGWRVAALVAAAMSISSQAQADVEFKFGGQVSSDLRFRLAGQEVPAYGTDAIFPNQQRLLKYGFSRNENRIKAQLSLGIGSRVKAVADVQFVFYGYSDLKDLNSTTYREQVDPYYLESDAAYLDVYKILPHLDLRIGRQIVTWGSADKFNPTNNLNTLDFSDPLLFGRAMANQMIRLDYNPISDLIITAVWVPIFRPSRLPRTAPLALTEANRPAPVQDDLQRSTLGFLASVNPPKEIRVYPMEPSPSIENSQVGVRISGRALNIDMAISYYYGRFGIPSPAWATLKPNGLVEVGIMWPRMQVLGWDLAGTIDKLGGLGWWIEGAVIFPQEITYGTIDALAPGQWDPVTFPKDPTTGQFSSYKLGYPEASRGVVIPSTPFVKLTAGVDYSFNKHIYANFQYVYGFIDEFGAGRSFYARPGAAIGAPARAEARIGHYLVAGADFKLAHDALLLRFFGAFKIPQVGDEDPHFTAVLFPQIVWAVWDATELSLGSFVFLGPRDSKFGDPSAGATELFLKAKFTY